MTKPLPDYSEWLTTERLHAEERYWDDPQHATWPAFIDAIERVNRTRIIHSIVEFGCGTGHVAAHLPGDILYRGIDANWFCLMKAKARNPQRQMFFVHGDIRKTKIVTSDYDLTCAFSVMKHFAQVEWHTVLGYLLSYGERGLFSMRIGDAIVDDGTEFPHLQVTPAYLEESVGLAGHKVVATTPLPWGEVMVETCRR